MTHGPDPNANPVGPEKRGPRYWERSDFWKDALERIVTSFVFGVVMATSIDQVTTADISWPQILLGGGIGGVLSSLKALVGAKLSNTTSPVSLT